MCKTNMKQIFVILTYENMNMKKNDMLWCKILPKINVEHTFKN